MNIFGVHVKMRRTLILVLTIANLLLFVIFISRRLGFGSNKPHSANLRNQVSSDAYGELVDGKKDKYRSHKRFDRCPNYLGYSQKPHGPFTNGRYKYPYMRPPLKCRTFTSQAVERLIEDLKSKVEDEDLARLIENCLPNTLDTTILWYDPAHTAGKTKEPRTFVVTGDIHAEWLRDSARQLSMYQPLIKYDKGLRDLLRGAINLQTYYINTSPYCNAFHPPPGSGVSKGDAHVDNVFPKPQWQQVFECKYELDSLASFLTLTNEYYQNSGDLSFVTPSWLQAYQLLLIVLARESAPTFNEKTGYADSFYYSFRRNTDLGSETLPLSGVGNPVNYGTGLVRSAFRPSDDACIFQFFIPANAYILVELKKTSEILDRVLKFNPESPVKHLLDNTLNFIQKIEKGIGKYGIVEHPVWGKVYAFEVDGYGGAALMDDANIPSLLSLPDLGFVDKNDDVYKNTRKMILSKSGNPYYINGPYFEGIGGPHIGIVNAWPMSLLMKIRTSDNDDEIKADLRYVMKTTANLGLMHESVNVHSENGKLYTRPWFAWCNSEFGKTILYLAKYKPHLIFKQEYKSIPYNLDHVLSSRSVN